jgi:thiamine-phosphate pyrophosphorylase
VLVGLTRDHGTDLVINDRPDVALIAGASGVHLGQHDLPVDEVRRFAGDRLLIGVSCAEFRHIGSGVRLGADVFGLGPVYPSTTKPKSEVNGTEFLRQAIAMLDGRAHLAISGIDGDNIDEIVEAGCRGVAVSSYVCSSQRPGAACERLLQVLAG